MKRERRFYEEQSEVLSNFIRILGLTLSVIFSIGAMIGAMITMYAAVANRTAEIGTSARARVPARGDPRRLPRRGARARAPRLGGGARGGVAHALVRISTMNWQSFAELAFSFTLTPDIVAQSFAFALAMGLVGGVLPACAPRG